MTAPPSESTLVVFITGCSDGGIGAALATEFARNGCLVYASSRSMKSMSDLPEDVRKLQVDVTNDVDCEQAVKTIYDEAGRIDIFVSNAGVANVGALVDITLETAQRVMNTNLFATVRLVRLIAPHMIKRGKGLIVPVGSTTGELSVPFLGYYNSSKAALHAYTETLALELKPFGVHAMLCAPGTIKTNIVNNEAHLYKANIPEGSVYRPYVEQLAKVLANGQEHDSMPANKFAQIVVRNSLASSPPTYMTAGGTTALWAFLKWLPRPLALRMIWNSTFGSVKT